MSALEAIGDGKQREGELGRLAGHQRPRVGAAVGRVRTRHGVGGDVVARAAMEGAQQAFGDVRDVTALVHVFQISVDGRIRRIGDEPQHDLRVARDLEGLGQGRRGVGEELSICCGPVRVVDREVKADEAVPARSRSGGGRGIDAIAVGSHRRSALRCRGCQRAAACEEPVHLLHVSRRPAIGALPALFAHREVMNRRLAAEAIIAIAQMQIEEAKQLSHLVELGQPRMAARARLQRTAVLPRAEDQPRAWTADGAEACDRGKRVRRVVPAADARDRRTGGASIGQVRVRAEEVWSELGTSGGRVVAEDEGLRVGVGVVVSRVAQDRFIEDRAPSVLVDGAHSRHQPSRHPTQQRLGPITVEPRGQGAQPRACCRCVAHPMPEEPKRSRQRFVEVATIERPVVAAPVAGEPGELDAARECDVGVDVVEREARCDRAERRVAAGREVLGRRAVVRDARRSHAPVRPRLAHDPVQHLDPVLDLVAGPRMRSLAERRPRAARIHIHPGIAVCEEARAGDGLAFEQVW